MTGYLLDNCYNCLFYLASDTCRILNIIYLRAIRSSLKKDKFDDSKWHDLGQQLSLRPDTLKAIKDDYSVDRRRLRETLVKWLEGADGVSPSWGSLVQALEAIDQKTVAENISELNLHNVNTL